MLRPLLLLGLPLLLLMQAGPSWGQDLDEAPACRPLYLCTPGTLECPHGGDCTCVPSCPICQDCAAFVCLPGAGEALDDDPSCRERREKFTQALEELVARASHCRENSDCVPVETRTACGPTCFAFVNRRVDHRVARAIRRLDQRACSEYVADGCPVTIPLCRPELPFCQEGRCVGRPLPRFQPQPTPSDPGSSDGGVGIGVTPIVPVIELP